MGYSVDCYRDRSVVEVSGVAIGQRAWVDATRISGHSAVLHIEWKYWYYSKRQNEAGLQHINRWPPGSFPFFL